jgi:D-glycero-alpha-D-manno-heptose-7-phosphate kinase
LIDFGKTITVEPLTLTTCERSTFENSLLLLYTGITRQSDTILSKATFNRRFLTREKELVAEGTGAVLRGNMFAFGDLLDEYWQIKRKLNKFVTNTFIDRMYDLALWHGAYGGKVVGAGGGGFLLLAVPTEERQTIQKTLALQELPFKIAKDGSKVIFSN